MITFKNMQAKEEDERFKQARAGFKKREDPHSILGLHEENQRQLIRLWRPFQERVFLRVLGREVEASKTQDFGYFEYRPDQKIQADDYQIYHPNGLLAHDPYAQKIRLSREDLELFQKGKKYDLYSILGANLKNNGILFAIWAPSAKSVSLLADFNEFNPLIHPMRRLDGFGVWELFVPGVKEGTIYQFEVHTPEGKKRIKSDPLGKYFEKRPKKRSIVFDVDRYVFKSPNSKRNDLSGPINVYEVHLGSWKSLGSEFPNFRQVAKELAKYVKKMGFTHVELLPIMEHPLDESWGYQVTGFFSTTSRFGSPEDFQYFVDYMHEYEIGVILDWVPAHFPIDEYALAQFDGTPLFEYRDPKKGFHPKWTTAVFNYGKKEVVNFLIASALYFFDKMKIDGLRVDAVMSLLYLDYGRKKGEWTPNPDGSNINHEAVAFLRELNQVIHEKYPHALMIAEDSSTFPEVTSQKGLRFDLKWNLGWSHDTLRYLSKDPEYRKHRQKDLTFSLIYAFNEQFMLALSHDDAARDKSLLAKMPGDDTQKFANMRLLYSYQMCHPGKKCIFMGSEIGPWDEWACKDFLDFDLLKFPLHQGLFKMFQDLNHLYLKCDPLWKYDFDWNGFEWLSFDDTENAILSYLRKADEKKVLCLHNFSSHFLHRYRIELPAVKKVCEIFNSDLIEYGGSNHLNLEIEGDDRGFFIQIAPLSSMIFDLEV